VLTAFCRKRESYAMGAAPISFSDEHPVGRNALGRQLKSQRNAASGTLIETVVRSRKIPREFAQAPRTEELTTLKDSHT